MKAKKLFIPVFGFVLPNETRERNIFAENVEKSYRRYLQTPNWGTFEDGVGDLYIGFYTNSPVAAVETAAVVGSPIIKVDNPEVEIEMPTKDEFLTEVGYLLEKRNLINIVKTFL